MTMIPNIYIAMTLCWILCTSGSRIAVINKYLSNIIPVIITFFIFIPFVIIMNPSSKIPMLICKICFNYTNIRRSD